MIATFAAATFSAILAALATVSLVFWLERRRRATVNVYGATAAPDAANPENKAAEAPADADRTEYTQAPHNAPPSLSSAGRPAIYRVAARHILSEAGEITADLLPPAEPREWDEIAQDALAALATMRNSASQYKSLAETMEASLYAARQDAEAQRNRADRLQALYIERTRQALHAGFSIVIDHAGRRNHDH